MRRRKYPQSYPRRGNVGQLVLRVAGSFGQAAADAKRMLRRRRRCDLIVDRLTCSRISDGRASPAPPTTPRPIRVFRESWPHWPQVGVAGVAGSTRQEARQPRHAIWANSYSPFWFMRLVVRHAAAVVPGMDCGQPQSGRCARVNFGPGDCSSPPLPAPIAIKSASLSRQLSKYPTRLARLKLSVCTPIPRPAASCAASARMESDASRSATPSKSASARWKRAAMESVAHSLNATSHPGVGSRVPKREPAL